MSSKWEKGWKVVRRNKERQMRSATVWGRVLRYYYNRTTKPKFGCGPLAMFRTRKAAREWSKNNRWLIVRKCIYLPSKDTKLWTVGREYHLNYCPEGTVLADAIRLIKEKH